MTTLREGIAEIAEERRGRLTIGKPKGAREELGLPSMAEVNQANESFREMVATQPAEDELRCPKCGSPGLFWHEPPDDLLRCCVSGCEHFGTLAEFTS